MEQAGLDLREMLVVLRRRWILLVTLSVVAGLVASIVSYFF